MSRACHIASMGALLTHDILPDALKAEEWCHALVPACSLIKKE